jgi:S-adenosylmethionine:tRNA ribosyltransferase-isomerase
VKRSDQNSPIFIDDFDYPLPDERIAKYQLAERDASKLLVYRNGSIGEDVFSNAVDYLPENALLVYNNTRVIQARMIFHKSTGARIEVFCLEPCEPSDYALSLSAMHRCEWICMVGNLKKWRSEDLRLNLEYRGKAIALSARLITREGDSCRVLFSWEGSDLTFGEILDVVGELPIPPYLGRETEESDKTSYQTVYSRIDGSVAAPTAGLHFTDKVLDSLKKKHISTCELTLHVGAGTFQPVKTNDIAGHRMHAEVISVHRNTILSLIRNEGNIIAVGTTSVRTLESLYYIGMQIHEQKIMPENSILVEQWEPYETDAELSTYEALQAILNYLDQHHQIVLHAQTRIMIRPGFRYRIISGMFTNFHQPRSTLLLLVSAWVGADWKTIYEYALSHDFRFLSYGDSSLLLK